MIVVDETADLFHLFSRHRATGPTSLIQGDTQIPYRPMPLPARAFTVRVAAGQLALHQEAPRDPHGDSARRGWRVWRGSLFLSPDGKSYDSTRAKCKCESRICEFPPISLNYLAIELPCEVPVSATVVECICLLFRQLTTSALPSTPSRNRSAAPEAAPPASATALPSGSPQSARCGRPRTLGALLDRTATPSD